MSAQQQFDYIIIGAGSAGCVLAALLSQDPDIRVALLEAGGPGDAPEISMPVAFPRLFAKESTERIIECRRREHASSVSRASAK